MSHKCHVHKCTKEVPPKMLMCLKHWKMVPRNIQLEVWRHYRPGQEITKDPSTESVKACQLAVASVIAAESGLSLDDQIKALEAMRQPKQKGGGE